MHCSFLRQTARLSTVLFERYTQLALIAVRKIKFPETIFLLSRFIWNLISNRRRSWAYWLAAWISCFDLISAGSLHARSWTPCDLSATYGRWFAMQLWCNRWTTCHRHSYLDQNLQNVANFFPTTFFLFRETLPNFSDFFPCTFQKLKLLSNFLFALSFILVQGSILWEHSSVTLKLATSVWNVFTYPAVC